MDLRRDMIRGWSSGVRDAVFVMALAIMLCWVLWIGRPLILPLLTAVILVYVLIAASNAVRSVPGLARLPGWAVTLVVSLALGSLVALLLVILVDNAARVIAALPRYEDNINGLILRLVESLGLGGEPSWTRVREVTLDAVDMRSLAAGLLYSLRGLSTGLFLVVLYSSFILLERRAFADKLARVIRDPESRQITFEVLSRVNARIGRYLAVKSFVNIVLGVLCYIVMVALGIEFAAFWAVLIGLMNYVPYIGSVIGVFFPVTLALAQFGSYWTAGSAALLLTTIQALVGSAIEPALMGRAFNLSPLVVLISVAFWAMLWGIGGAILAVPLTASLIIVMGEFAATRPIAVLLSTSPTPPWHRLGVPD